MRMEHWPKNGTALAGLGAAADLIAKHILAGHYDMATVCARTGLNPPVVLRFLNQHIATEHSLACLEAAFHVRLPRPKAELYSLTDFRAKWCGYEYEIAGPTGSLKGWHKGSEEEVRMYTARVITRAHFLSTVVV